MKTFQNEIHSILEELEKVLVSKNIDYGNSFDIGMEEWGLASGGQRIGDKYNRLKQLVNPDHQVQVNDEALDDTVLDLAGYAILFYRYLQNKKSEK